MRGQKEGRNANKLVVTLRGDDGKFACIPFAATE